MKKLENAVVAVLLLMVATPAVIGILVLLNAAGGVLWTEKAAGWIQAVGSIAAIWFAYLFGERQSASALASVREGERLSAARRYDSILALADSAEKFCTGISKVFEGGQYAYLELKIKYQNGAILDDLLDALKAVPAHEIGSYNAVLALASLRKAMVDFKGNVERARADVDNHRMPGTNGIPFFLKWDTVPMELCIDSIRRATKGLRDHRPAFST